MNALSYLLGATQPNQPRTPTNSPSNTRTATRSASRRPSNAHPASAPPSRSFTNDLAALTEDPSLFTRRKPYKRRHAPDPLDTSPSKQYKSKKAPQDIAVPYPSPPPTPPALITDLSPLDQVIHEAALTPLPLSRAPSLKHKEASVGRIRRIANTIPVRVSVALYVLIRRFLRLFGIHILSPPSSPILVQQSASPQEEQPPSYADATAAPHRAVPRRSRWSLSFTRSRSDTVATIPEIHTISEKGSDVESDHSPTVSRRSSFSASELLSPGARSSSVTPSPASSLYKSSGAIATRGLLQRKLLVLDLDETLIHSTSRMGGLPGVGHGRWRGKGLKVRVIEVVVDGRSVIYHVYKRPWVDFFLRKVSSWYTVIIFTASMREYADPVIDWLDQGRGMFGARYFRESCTLTHGAFVKDLTVVDSDLTKVCLVDNSPASYSRNQANGIPIEGWISDPNDEALLDLLPMLDSLRFTSDVRRILGLKGFGATTGATTKTK